MENTLGNFGYSNQSWIGNNAILNYSSYHDVGSLGNKNFFIPTYPGGVALVLKPDYNNGNFSGFIHKWNNSTTQVDFDQFQEIWRLDENSSYLKGKLGIGKEATSAAQLDVNGVIYGRELISVINGGSYRVSINGQSDGYIVGRNQQNENTFRITSSGTSYINGGGLAIGTTATGGYDLAVKGKIKTEEVRVSIEDWPDYVFSEDYSTLTLNELDDYIKIYHHLPGIPDATTVEKEGVDVGEMNKLLLEKIEELTLYLIEASKLLEKHEEEISVLKKQLIKE